MDIIPRTIAILLAAAGVSGVQAATPPLVGAWGGPGIHLVLTETGGSIDFDCGTARITAPVIPDSKGHFTATGDQTQWHGGPQLADVPPAAARSVTFKGTLDGDSLMLEMRPAGKGPSTQFALRAGARTKLIRCF